MVQAAGCAVTVLSHHNSYPSLGYGVRRGAASRSGSRAGRARGAGPAGPVGAGRGAIMLIPTFRLEFAPLEIADNEVFQISRENRRGNGN